MSIIPDRKEATARNVLVIARKLHRAVFVPRPKWYFVRWFLHQNMLHFVGGEWAGGAETAQAGEECNGTEGVSVICGVHGRCAVVGMEF